MWFFLLFSHLKSSFIFRRRSCFGFLLCWLALWRSSLINEAYLAVSFVMIILLKDVCEEDTPPHRSFFHLPLTQNGFVWMQTSKCHVNSLAMGRWKRLQTQMFFVLWMTRHASFTGDEPAVALAPEWTSIYSCLRLLMYRRDIIN